MSGPRLEGRIILNTSSVKEAIQSVGALEGKLKQMATAAGQSSSGVEQGIKAQEAAYKSLSRSLAGLTKEERQAQQLRDRQNNLIAIAANRVANYEKAVNKSITSEQQRNRLIQEAAAQLKGYASAVENGAVSGARLQNINTELGVSLGQLNREMQRSAEAERNANKEKQESERTQIRVERALSQSAQQYARVEAAVKRSSLSTEEELQIVNELEQAHQNLQKVLKDGTSSRQQIAQAQNQFNESMNKANIASRTGQMKQSADATRKMQDEMRNLSTSVVVALGPLSGLASRLTALTTLFNRNGLAIGAALASMTGLTVAFAQSAKYAEQAERSMLRIDSQIALLGDSAQVTAEDIQYLAHQLADETLLGAQQVREASSVLLEFGGVARNQFGQVIKTAQGMASVFGGDVVQATRQIARAIEDPSQGMTRLSQRVGELDEATQKTIATLIQQGKQFEATNVLLGAMSSLTSAAEKEASGLAGAYDAVSGSLDLAYEALFITSGAIDSLNDSVRTVASSLSDFADSTAAIAIGKMFESIARVAGGGLQLMIDNVEWLSVVVAGLVAGSLAKMLVSLTLLAARTNLVSGSVALLTAGKIKYGAAAKAATVATTGLSTAMRAMPLVSAASALTAVVGTLWSLHSAQKAVDEQILASGNAIYRRLRNEITARQDLTKAQAEQLKAESELLGAQSDEITKELQEQYKIREDLAEQVQMSYRQELRGLEAIKNSFTGLNEEQETRYKQLSEINSLAEQGNLGSERALDLFQQMAKDGVGPVIEEMINLQKAIAANEGDAEELNKRFDELLKTIRSVESSKATEDLNRSIAQVTESAEKLRAEFLPEEETRRKLQEALEGAIGLRDRLQEMVADGQDVNEQLGITERAIAAIGDQMSEGTKEFQKALDAATAMAREITNLNTEANLAEGLINNEDMERQMAYSNRMVELRDRVHDMDDAARELLATQIGLNEAATADEVASAFARQVIAEEQRLEKAKELNEEYIRRKGLMRELSESEMSQMEKLIEKRNDLMTISEDSSEAASIAAWFQREVDEMNQIAESWYNPMTDMEKLEHEWEQRRELLGEMFDKESEDYARHLEKMKAEEDRQKLFQTITKNAEMASDVVSQSMDVMETANRKNSTAYKAMAMMQATINAALAISQVWADQSLPTIAKIGMSALAGAQAGAQIAAIRSANYAEGGLVRGPGSGTSDSIPANLSNGEFVIRAAAVRALGLDALESLNQGRMPYNTGGAVGSPVYMPPAARSSSGMNVTIVDQTTGSHEYDTMEETGPDGDRQIRILIRDTVKDVINRGEVDREFGGRYDMKPKGRRV